VPGAPPALIEVAFDKGDIVAGGDSAGVVESGGKTATAAVRGEPIAEVELELKAGPTRGLYHLLGDLRTWAPVHVAVGSKAERGYRLADGTAPAATRATNPALDPEMTVGEALGEILHNCLAQWLANIAAAGDGRDIEGVHQLRIAVRRSRSALSLFTAAIGRDQRLAWNDRLKAVIAATGDARQLDVFLAETVPAVADGLAAEDEAALEALSRRTEAARALAYEEVRAFLDGRDHADLVLDFASWMALDGWHEAASAEARAWLVRPVVELARRLLEKRHRRVRKLGRHFARLSDAERHEVRLALKKLRYGVEFLGGLFPGKAAKRYAKAASALQDVLGRLNDQAETRALLRRLADGAPAGPAGARLALARGHGFVLGWQAQGLTGQRAAATAAWDRFMAQPLFWHHSGDQR
jgi:inorganic triphosphatase YgiF